MPIHDWTRVDAGIFHHFHQRWVGAITDVLNQRLLPRQYYALAEQQGGGFEPDVLTLKASGAPEPDDDAAQPPGTRPSGNGDGDDSAGGGIVVAEPPVRITAETDLEFYRRKQNVVAVRHVSGDRLVAIVEVVSKGNKSGRKALEDFVRKAAEFLEHRVHLLILDLQPPTRAILKESMVRSGTRSPGRNTSDPPTSRSRWPPTSRGRACARSSSRSRYSTR